jgi:hypothetical protein
MAERRLEPRLLCADLIDVFWTDDGGCQRTARANLEDISLSGACVQLDTPVPHETLLRIAHPKHEMEGRVRYCIFRETGYFIGVQFVPGTRWSQRQFRPKHLLDPRRPLGLTLRRTLAKGNGNAAKSASESES